MCNKPTAQANCALVPESAAAVGGFRRLVEENEGCESDRNVELHSKECIGDEMEEFCI
jgi:hypothetical protein